jgi:hypothetical protein
MQNASDCLRHEPPMQHAPDGPQVLGEQVPPSAHVCAAVPQAACSVSEQAPLTKLQQRPMSVQGSGEQTPAAHVVEALAHCA